MKKKIIGIVAAITIALVGLTGCNTDTNVSNEDGYTVKSYEYKGHEYLVFKSENVVKGGVAIDVIEVK